MQAELVGTLENATGDLVTCLYQLPDGDYRIWLRVGVALLELGYEQIEELKEHLDEMQAIIEMERANARR